jgi:predicted RecA/RadA family phage recombinase
MKYFSQEGEVLDLTTPVGGVTSGNGYQVGQIFGVACKSITAAEQVADATIKFPALVRGVAQLTKVGSQAWTEGELIYWDDGNARCTSVPTGNRLIGAAVLNPETGAMPGSGSTVTTGYVYLDGAVRDNEAT